MIMPADFHKIEEVTDDLCEGHTYTPGEWAELVRRVDAFVPNGGCGACRYGRTGCRKCNHTHVNKSLRKLVDRVKRKECPPPVIDSGAG